ncbi:hypothetical protein [Prevotella sp.]|uniref:hypothetical protein n=1 Tax=Prevotella sp. TaxID=59823 RepID=UPI002648667E|nr:hypothetical protein [Prevotella sp.]MDN5553313.1 hypothetical protein [Prevotella sp.]
MKFKILVVAKKFAFTISLILTLLSTFTSCSKDDDGVVDKEFANTAWIHRYSSPHDDAYAEALVFYSDGTVKEFGLDSHDKIIDEYSTYRFFRINVNHISFLDTDTKGYLVDHNHFTFYFNDYYKSSYHPEDLA